MIGPSLTHLAEDTQPGTYGLLFAAGNDHRGYFTTNGDKSFVHPRPQRNIFALPVFILKVLEDGTHVLAAEYYPRPNASASLVEGTRIYFSTCFLVSKHRVSYGMQSHVM